MMQYNFIDRYICNYKWHIQPYMSTCKYTPQFCILVFDMKKRYVDMCVTVLVKNISLFVFLSSSVQHLHEYAYMWYWLTMSKEKGRCGSDTPSTKSVIAVFIISWRRPKSFKVSFGYKKKIRTKEANSMHVILLNVLNAYDCDIFFK